MHDIRELFPTLFDGTKASNRPIANRNREHCEKWGLQKTLFDLGHENIMEIKEIQKNYLTTMMNFLTYCKDKSFADKAQDDLDERMRKIKR